MRRLCLLLLLVLGTSGAIAQTISEPLRGAGIVSEAMELDTRRTGSARYFDPQDGQFDFIKGPKPGPLFFLRNVPHDRPASEASKIGGSP